MDTSNHWYGHAHILARYCGLDDTRPPLIWGVIQHGWNILHGFGPGHEPPVAFTKFVWSDVVVRRGQAAGWRDFFVIGAPWAYLLTEFEAPPPAQEREGTIYYPFHTWDHGQIEGDHSGLIDTIRDTEPGPVTVCLYWIEYDIPEVRHAYEEAGFRVICHGRRGWLKSGTDPQFLYKQHAELARHRRVASNRLTSAILYGASMGCEVGVYGDPMAYTDVRDAHAHHIDGNDTARRLFPGMEGEQIDPDLAREVARTELGLDQLATPEELRDVFGWRLTA